MKKLFSVILVLFLFFVLLPASVSAESLDVYVSSTGSDENSGTAETPYATLEKAIEAVPDNGTIHVVGTVKVTSDITCTARGQSITITGDTLDLTGVTAVVFGDAVTFQNITIAGPTSDDGLVGIYANGYKMVMAAGIHTSGKIELFGGGNGTSVKSTDLTVLSGTYKAIYGGSARNSENVTGKVTGDINLYVGGNTNASADITDKSTAIGEGTVIYGGGKYSPTEGKVNVTFTENARSCYVYGGGRGSSSKITGGIRVDFRSGTVMDVTGGGLSSGNNGKVEVMITGGTMDQVFGGAQAATANDDVTVWLLGGTVNRRVYGGCYNEYATIGGWQSEHYVNGNIRLLIGGSPNITFASSDSDRSIYARSRHSTNADAENAELIFLDETAYNAYKNKLGAQDSGMKFIMGSADIADAIHYFTYEASGNTITGTCAYEDGCTVAPAATLELDSSASLQYTSQPITPAVVTTSNWYAATPEIQYENNIDEGTATASMTVNGVTASLNFDIEPAYFRSLSLGESIAINFKAARSFLEARNFEKIEFYMDGKLMQVITGIPAGNADRASFTFNQLTPAQMGKEVTARFCFADGTYDERSTSVLAYALSMLKKDATEAKLKTLLVDMLGYGAASQTYVGDTEALVSAGEYAGLGTTADPALVNHTALKDAPETEQAAWLSAGLNLKDSVTVRLKFSADSTDGLTLKVTCDGNTWEITNFQATTGGYYAYFSGLNPAQLRETMEAALYNADGAKVSKTLTYSVVSYAHAVANGTDTALQPLMKALMRYGDAVADWVGEEYVASVTADGKTTYFETLEEAIERANAADTDAKVVVWESISIGSAIEINNNVTIVNAPGKDITISRGDLAANMFTVNKGGSLTLGTNDAAQTGKLIIDGASADAIAFRTVTVAKDATFTLGKNATLCNANSTTTGGALQTSGTAYLYGTVSNNNTALNGGAVYVNGAGAVLNLEGGTIIGGTATGNGGSVYLEAGAVFTMNDGLISGGNANQGGNVYVHAATAEATTPAAFTLAGGTIENGNAATGGNLAALGIFEMTGGTITGGTTSGNATGANVYSKPGADGCTFTMTGGTIMGGVRINDKNGAITLGGSAKIKGGETNLTLSNAPAKLETTGFNADAEIWVNVEYEACYLIDVYFGTAAAGDEVHIKSEDGSTVVATNGKLSLITDWTSATSLPDTTGNYRLMAETVTLSAALSVKDKNTVRLDLNGSNVEASNKRIIQFTGTGVTLSIYNSRSEGGLIKPTRTSASTSDGGVVYMKSAGNIFNLYGGTLDGSGITLDGKNGGVVYVGAGSTFNMYGGTVTGGTATNNGTGGNIYIQAGSEGGEFNMHDGVVTEGTAAQGGNIYVAAGSTNATNNAAAVFNLYDGTISAGEGTSTAGNVAALGVMKMEGGEIKDGICNVTGDHKYAANVYTLPGKNKCTFTMTGGTITGWVRVNNAGSFILGGTAKITNGIENASTNNAVSGMYVSTNGATVTVDTTKPLTTGAEIYLSSTGNDPIVKGNIAAEYQSFFKYCADGTLSFDENGIHVAAAE